MATIATMIIIITCNTIAEVVVCNDYYIIAYLLMGEEKSSLFFNGDVLPPFIIAQRCWQQRGGVLKKRLT